MYVVIHFGHRGFEFAEWVTMAMICRMVVSSALLRETAVSEQRLSASGPVRDNEPVGQLTPLRSNINAHWRPKAAFRAYQMQSFQADQSGRSETTAGSLCHLSDATTRPA